MIIMTITQTSDEFLSVRPIRFYLTAATVAAVFVGGLSGCTGPKADKTASPESSADTAAQSTDSARTAQPARPLSVPASLSQMGEYGENIYDAAKVGKWKEVEAKLGALRRTIQDSSQDLAKAAKERIRLNTAVAALDGSVNKRDIPGAMRDANQVTLVAADLTARYHPRVPADVVRLDYDGRELEIWSAAKSAAKLKETAQNMRQTWNRVRPEVEAHNGAAEAKKFDGLITQIEGAQSIAQYQKLVAPVLDQVDNLEKVF